MKNLDLENALTVLEIDTINYFGSIYELNKQGDISLKINNLMENTNEILNRNNIRLLYQLSQSIDISNPYECYDYIQKIIAKEEGDYGIKASKIRRVLNIQFGDNWIRRLLEEEYTVKKLLCEDILISIDNAKQISWKILDLKCEIDEILLNDDKNTKENGYIDELEYKIIALRNYAKCKFK